MSPIGNRATAGQVKVETGYNEGEWSFFQRATKSLARGLLHLDYPQEDYGPDFNNGIGSLAEEMTMSRGGCPATWERVNPAEANTALQLLNAEFARQQMEPVTHNVFRWRMVQVMRYVKRERPQTSADPRIGQTGAQPSAHGLPPISVMLGNADHEKAG